MPAITDQVVDFYDELFKKVFFEGFARRISDRRRRDAVERQVLEAAAAASQSLERFLISQQFTDAQADCIFGSLDFVKEAITLEQIANPYTLPEKIVEDLLKLPVGVRATEAVGKEDQAAVYRVALHSVVQALMQVGPVMSEWQKTGFPTTFELSKQVIARLNEISSQLDTLARAGAEAADERFDLLYRDTLSQRFYRVEAGTVKMTTNLSVDLRELFVMPNVVERPQDSDSPRAGEDAPVELMGLSQAREFLAAMKQNRGEENSRSALEQVRNSPRTVIVGPPGGGKSTFLEWLQLKLASAQEEFILAGQQAIPMLLRIRQLDPDYLPKDSALIEKATGSRDLAALMPPGWLDRQMARGAVIFLLDGLDEVEPQVRDAQIVPWFTAICQRYPDCRYVVSSRPVGYPAGLMRDLSFLECDLAEFNEGQVTQYARHWCTAVRLARSEPAEEARRDGTDDGERIVAGFKGHAYIESLARNPLMLSAICLVNYFEGGQLPKDRTVLYRLCVEGLLHNWDQRRGIRSDFTFEEKLRVCREVALQMQARDRAEHDLADVRRVFAAVLKDEDRASRLLEYIRYRTGLLLERRPGVFAFAHLTFQEYLAARAVHEGNLLGVDADRLLQEHSDQKWQEVIALYCGIVPAPAARQTVERLLTYDDVCSCLLAEAYLSSGPELAQDVGLMRKVIRTIAAKDLGLLGEGLALFPDEEVAPIANELVNRADLPTITEGYLWLLLHETCINHYQMAARLRNRSGATEAGIHQLCALVHMVGPDEVLSEVASNSELYALPASPSYRVQAGVAIQALLHRSTGPGPGADAAFLRALRTIASSVLAGGVSLSYPVPVGWRPSEAAWTRCAPLVKRIDSIRAWYEQIDQLYAKQPAAQPEPKSKRKK